VPVTAPGRRARDQTMASETSRIPRTRSRSTLWLLLLALGLALGPACSCDEDKRASAPVDGRDAGEDDGRGPPPEVDSGPYVPPVNPDLIPGDPPAGLEGEACAVDTNKLFELANSDGIVGDTILAVDLIESEFAMVFVDDSDECSNAVNLARYSGSSGSGRPDVELALDPCASIGRTALANNDTFYVLATVDDRGGPMDVWVQLVGDTDGADAFQVTDTPRTEIDVAVMAAPPLAAGEAETEQGAFGFAAVAWVEEDVAAGTQTLQAQMLDVDGQPNGPMQVLYPHGEHLFSSVSLARVGENKLGIGYRRYNRSGLSEIVFEVRDGLDGMLIREPMVLTEDAGDRGTIEVASDELGGALTYSIQQGNEGQQVWFLRLDESGQAARVVRADDLGGRSSPKRVVKPPGRGIDSSIALLPRGYVVAYRALPYGERELADGGTSWLLDEAQIRVQFLDRFGELIGGPSAVAYAEEEGGRTTITAAFDGRVALGWTDATDDLTGTRVMAVRLPCLP